MQTLKLEVGKTVSVLEDGKTYKYKVLEIYEDSVLVIDLKNDMECELPLEAFKL